MAVEDTNLNNTATTQLTGNFIFNASTPENLNQLKEQAFELIDSEDRDATTAFARGLEKALLNSRPSNEQENRALDIAIFWMLKLYLFSFRVLGLTEQLDFLKKYTSLCFADGLDLHGAVFDYVDLFDSGTTVQNLTNQYVRALTTSKTLLGDPQAFKNGFKPTLANWLSEYQVVLNKRKTNATAEIFDVITFIDTNVNIKFLTELQKEVLRNLLGFYNFLLNPVVYKDNVISSKKPSLLRPQQRPEDFVNPLQGAFVQNPSQPKPVPPPPVEAFPSPIQRPRPVPPVDLPIHIPGFLGASPDGVNVQKRLYKEDVDDDKAGLAFDSAKAGQSATVQRQTPPPKRATPAKPLETQTVPSAQKDGFPVFKVKADQNLADIKDRVGYTAKPDASVDLVQKKLEELKKRAQKN